MSDLRRNQRVVTNMGGRGKVVGFRTADKEILVLIDGTDIAMRYTRAELFKESDVKARAKIGKCDCCYHPKFNPDDKEVFISKYRNGSQFYEQQLCAGCGGLTRSAIMVGRGRKVA